MTVQSAARECETIPADEISLLALGTLILRWRRVIVGLAGTGLLLGVIFGLTKPKLYVASATFLPQGAESPNSGLAAAASQFGIRVPTGGSTWGPAIYVQLLRSRTLLEPIALDTLVVAEDAGRRAAVMELLEIADGPAARRLDLAVRRLSAMVTAEEARPINAVNVGVSSRWPSVSLAISERLVRGVNQFNLQTRKSQAASERQFVEARATDAERALREAEDHLQAHLQQNRIINPSSQTAMERDRRQRDVVRRQQLYTTLLENLEDARIREVRDTPVITLLAEPRLPILPEARGTITKGVLGALAGAAIGFLIALFAEGLARARRESSDESREFFQMLEHARPRFLRKSAK